MTSVSTAAAVNSSSPWLIVGIAVFKYTYKACDEPHQSRKQRGPEKSREHWTMSQSLWRVRHDTLRQISSYVRSLAALAAGYEAG